MLDSSRVAMVDDLIEAVTTVTMVGLKNTTPILAEARLLGHAYSSSEKGVETMSRRGGTCCVFVFEALARRTCHVFLVHFIVCLPWEGFMG